MFRVTVLLVGVAALATAQTRSGSIAGRVLNLETGEPVRKAEVQVIWHGNPRSAATAISDGSGRFVFDLLPPGQYELHATKQGFSSIAYGAAAPFQMGKLITLAAGENKTGMDVQVVRLGAVYGTVTDQDGDPVIHANVQILIETFERGTSQLAMRGSVNTNDRGEYRFTNLQPGRYYVQATSAPILGYFGGGRADREGVQPVFYPGVGDPRKASPVVVAGAQQIRGIDFRLTTTRVRTLRGRVIGVPDVDPKPNVSVAALPAATMLQMHGAIWFGAAPPEYRFEVPQLTAGSYRLVVDTTIGDKRYRTIQRVEVGENTDEVAIPLTPAGKLQGTLRYEGDPALKPGRFHVQLVPGDGLPSEGDLSADVGPDGKFTIEQVPQGVWDISPGPVPRGGYLKSMHLGKQDVLTEEMVIEPDTNAPLNIVISSRGARVEGSVDTAPALVILAPWGKFRSVMSFFQGRPTDDKGHFEMTGVTPGEYRLFAVKGLAPGPWQKPGFLERYEDQSLRIVIGEGEKIAANPKVIAMDPDAGERK